MNSKFLLSALAAAVVMFIGGFIIYGFILMDYMKAHSTFMTDQPPMWSIIINSLSMGVLYAYIIHIGNIRSLVNGMITGGIAGFLICLAGDAMMLGGKMYDSPTAMLASTAAGTILGALAGATAGTVYGMGDKSEANNPAV